jgi:hypothetical protein
MPEHLLDCLRWPSLYFMQSVEQLLGMAQRRGLAPSTDELRAAAADLVRSGTITTYGDDWWGVTRAQLRALDGPADPVWAPR